MAKRLNGRVAEFTMDNLFAATYPNAITGHVSLTKDKGVLKRGSVLAKTDAGTYELLETATAGKAAFILADDVDTAEEPCVGEVYKTGNFVEEALIAAEGYTFSAADREALRDVGILLSTGIGY